MPLLDRWSAGRENRVGTIRRAGLASLLMLAHTAHAAFSDDAWKAYRQGDYSQALKLANRGLGEGAFDEELHVVHALALFTLGKYENAHAAVLDGLGSRPGSMRLRLLGREICPFAGETEMREKYLSGVSLYVTDRFWSEDPAVLVAWGRAMLIRGANPKDVLDKFFEKARKLAPDHRDSYLAIGELALEKDDYELARKNFAAALKKFPDDADAHLGLAAAFAPSDPEQMKKSLAAALKLNPRHVPSLLLQTDALIDSDALDDAAKSVEQVLAVNPNQPEAWAYRAVLAHLNSDTPGEKKARTTALKFWATNPKVDHLIGRKLSQKYRFSEGSAYQRRALEFDPEFQPARQQLALDLLRLGKEEEGLKLAEDVSKANPYNVQAYNLVTLERNLGKFKTLEDSEFIVRMDPLEASVYGDRVMALLKRARATLCKKYGLDLKKRIIVEIFPDQRDFAVRTFGMPGGESFLGVCFGPVVTAVSAGSATGSRQNWQTVLWHEFTHVVTLTMTANKMPRWLSEGISVYEETQANPGWNRGMTPEFRQKILDGEMTSISGMDNAFRDPENVNFAYFISGLAVEFYVKEYGFDALKRALTDVGKGVPVNKALETRGAPLAKMEKDFAGWAWLRADGLAPGLDWEKPEENLATFDLPKLARWIEGHPKNLRGLTAYATRLAGEKKWTEAKPVLEQLIKLYPSNTAAGNAYELLGEAHRAAGDVAREKQTLQKLAALDAEAASAFTRLMEIASIEKDWPAVVENAERLIALNPMLGEIHRYLARTSEASGRKKEAIAAYRSVLALKPADPADAHFQLARLLRQSGDPGAKRHVLEALEETPRFEPALDLLLSISSDKPATSTTPAALKKP